MTRIDAKKYEMPLISVLMYAARKIDGEKDGWHKEKIKSEIAQLEDLVCLMQEAEREACNE